MNYYNPYLFNMPTSFTVPRAGGIFSRLFGGIKFGSILNGTQRVLNFTNQLIPVVKQVQPMVKNAKTMFRVMNEFKKTDTKSINSNNKSIKNNLSDKKSFSKVDNDINDNTNTNYQNQGPTFFM